MSPNSKRIVGEVSKSWPSVSGRNSKILSERFEEIIAVNRERGYALESWQITSAMSDEGLTETIIAVFVEV